MASLGKVLSGNPLSNHQPASVTDGFDLRPYAYRSDTVITRSCEVSNDETSRAGALGAPQGGRPTSGRG